MADSSFKTFKRRRKAEQINTDCINTLPDSLLCHILSFLSTKTTVTTIPLVSRRWRHLWENLQVFDFYHKYNKHTINNNNDDNNDFRKFAAFVNSVLSIRRSRDIRKMRLSCGHSEVDHFFSNSIDSWIRSATGSCLEELDLTLFYTDREYVFSIFLTILATCTNLVSLSLCGDIYLVLERSSMFCLPSLKKLQLDIGYVEMNSMDNLLSSCPILETLELSIAPDRLARLRVPPSLKRFKFTVENNFGAYLEIDAPDLKYLSLTNITFSDAATIGNLDKVEEAYLNVFSTPENESVDPLFNLLRALSRIKHLMLCLSTTKWLFAAPVIDVSEFHYLLHLEVILPSFSLSFLMSLLQKCPMLQDLIIQNDKRLAAIPFYGLAKKSKNVPNCLVSHLNFIHFKGYQACLHEMEFVGYVLRNGLVLKTMLISGLSLDKKEKWEKYLILKEFSDIPKGSANCQLKFD